MRKVCNILLILIILGVLVVLGLLGIPMLMGSTPVPLTASYMQPAYPAGSVLFVKQVPTTSLAEGEVVCYETAVYGERVVARITAIDRDTQMLEVAAEDGTMQQQVPFADLEGRVNFSLPLLGYIVEGVRTPVGMGVIGALVVLVVLLLLLPSLSGRSQKKKQEQRRAMRLGLYEQQRRAAGLRGVEGLQAQGAAPAGAAPVPVPEAVPTAASALPAPKAARPPASAGTAPTKPPGWQGQQNPGGSAANAPPIQRPKPPAVSGPAPLSLFDQVPPPPKQPTSGGAAGAERDA